MKTQRKPPAALQRAVAAQASPAVLRRVPPPLIRRTLQHNVYDYLRDGLATGDFSPGQRLTIRGVAEQIGTSIMPVREAFRRLTSEGALEPLSSGATRVPILDFAKLQDLFEIRLMVEGLAARRAATKMTDAEYDLLVDANEELQKATRLDDITAEAKANERFHFGIYRAAHSAELLRIIEHLWLQMGPYLQWLLRHGEWPKQQRHRAAFHHHKEILEALQENNASQAEKALRADLMTASELLLTLARQLPRPTPP
jgi:DNA-binding GntR family transcriptional regulator